MISCKLSVVLVDLFSLVARRRLCAVEAHPGRVLPRWHVSAEPRGFKVGSATSNKILPNNCHQNHWSHTQTIHPQSHTYTHIRTAPCFPDLLIPALHARMGRPLGNMAVWYFIVWRLDKMLSLLGRLVNDVLA